MVQVNPDAPRRRIGFDPERARNPDAMVTHPIDEASKTKDERETEEKESETKTAELRATIKEGPPTKFEDPGAKAKTERIKKAAKVVGAAAGGTLALGAASAGGVFYFGGRFISNFLLGIKKILYKPGDFFKDIGKRYLSAMSAPPKGKGFFKGFWSATGETIFGEPLGGDEKESGKKEPDKKKKKD